MQKHNSLTDLLRLLISHGKELKNTQIAEGKLSTVALAKIFSESSDPLATSFTYVFGSMRGSQDLQYSDMLQTLTKMGLHTVANILKKRQSLPCIDLQESIWLINRESKRDRSRDYGYRDYPRFKNRQFVSGKALNFQIDWDMAGELAAGMGINPVQESDAAVSSEVGVESIEETEPFTELDQAGIDAANEERIKRISRHQGSPAFRKALLDAYNGRCAITGANTSDVLDAVVISQDLEFEPMKVSDGLLLRTDIHRLFDEHLLSIDPSSYEVVLAPKVSNSEYRDLEGISIELPLKEEDWPDSKSLQSHFDTFMKRLS